MYAKPRSHGDWGPGSGLAAPFMDGLSNSLIQRQFTFIGRIAMHHDCAEIEADKEESCPAATYCIVDRARKRAYCPATMFGCVLFLGVETIP